MNAPATIGKYQVQDVLGQGGMGIVYRAFDPAIERTVAIKVITKSALDPSDLQYVLTRFRHEARAVGRLTHPRIAAIYNHHVRDLAERLTLAQHEHHDLVVTTTHLHLDHEHCLENAFLKGSTAAVRAFADRILAERGVTHGQLNLITVASGDEHALESRSGPA